MSRIRSLHPGIFTDDAYMALSFPSRELIKGLWCEADDNGVFVWKPLTIKARVFPADNLDINDLLAELVAGQFIKQHQHGDRSYGAIRNFLKFQRPRRPSASHPLPDNAAKYLGGPPVIPGIEPIEEDIIPPPSEPLPTMSGMSPQMEDGGGSKEGSVSSLRSETAADAALDPVKELFDRGVAVFTAANVPEKQARSIIGQARRDFGELAVIQAIGVCEDSRPSNPVEFFPKCLPKRRGRGPPSNGGYVPMHPGAGG